MPGFLATLCVSPSDGVAGIALANATAGPESADRHRPGDDRGRERAASFRRAGGRCPRRQSLLALTACGTGVPAPTCCGCSPTAPWSSAGGRPGVLRFRAEPDGTWTGLDGYYNGETLRLVRGADGAADHLDLGSFVSPGRPYGPDAPLARATPEGCAFLAGSSFSRPPSPPSARMRSATAAARAAGLGGQDVPSAADRNASSSSGSGAFGFCSGRLSPPGA